MNAIVEILEEKSRLIKRRQEIIEQLAGNPREPFCFALEKDLAKTEEGIFNADERFVLLYQQYKKRLPTREDGDIDVSKLRDADRVILKKIRELVREITGILMENR